MSVVSGGANVSISITQTGQIGVNQATPLSGGVLSFRSAFTNGSAPNQFALLSPQTYNFLASTPQTLDFTSMLDQLKATITFAMIEFLAYRIQSQNAAFTLLAGGAGANEWDGITTSGSKAIWYPSTALNDGFAVMQFPNGIPVNAGSKLLKLDPGANAVGLVDIIVAGY